MTKRIVVVAYDPGWPEFFEAERERLATAFRGSSATIEHVGSTSVPGLAAKPVIDIMVGVRALSDVEARTAGLAECGYHYVPEYEVQLLERRYFRRPLEHPRTHHLHCVLEGGDFWNRHLAFRDHLRAHPETARQYAELKERLAVTHRTDGQAYAEAKSPFIESVLGIVAHS